MPTDLPERKDPDAKFRVSGRLVVILIVVWTAVLLAAATVAIKKLESDPCWDRGPNHPPPPAECKPVAK